MEGCEFRLELTMAVPGLISPSGSSSKYLGFVSLSGGASDSPPFSLARVSQIWDQIVWRWVSGFLVLICGGVVQTAAGAAI